MHRHVMSITYQPKIEPVKDGRCTQTIRKGRRVAEGDEILFHGWVGRPYRSKWDWRKRVTVTEVITICIDDILGIATLYSEKSNLLNWHSWGSQYVEQLAEYDFIDPPTGEALRGVLFGLNGAPDGPGEYQIIRWKNRG